MVATVLLMTAGVVMFMVSNQSGDFGSFLNNQSDTADCELKKINFKNACDCDNPSDFPSKAEKIRDEAQAQCDWFTGSTTCKNVCP